MSDMERPVYIVEDPRPESEAVDLITGCERFENLQNFILGATMAQRNDPEYFRNPALFTSFEAAVGEAVSRVMEREVELTKEKADSLVDDLVRLTSRDVTL